MGTWRAYFPDDGGSPETAFELFPATRSHCYTAEDAAWHAVEQDYSDSAGERGLDRRFAVVVISPTGEETHWWGENSATVIHTVEKVDTPHRVT